MFEDVDLLFGDADAALLDQIHEQQVHDRLFNEITEQEYLQGVLDEHRQAPNLAFARELSDTALNALTDTEAMDRLIQVEAGIARAQATRARLVGLLAANRPASADRPDGKPGAAGWQTRRARKTAASPEPGTQAPTGAAAGTGAQVGDDQVPEVLAVSEWLAHELQMAHPYSWTAAQDLVETSLVLTGRLTATLALLREGRIDYPRARILTDLLGTCSAEVAHTVQAIVLPKAPGLTPGGLATAVRRALTRVDAAALRRRHAAARRAADVGYYPTTDGMARLYADLPLPVAAACVDAVSSYAASQQQDGDTRPIGQIRTEVLTDLILRPFDTTRPAVTAQVTIHLTIPTSTGTSLDTAGTARGNGAVTRLDDDAAEAEVNGQIVTAAQCAELLTQLQASRLFLALHHPDGQLQAVATPAQLRRATRRDRRRTRRTRAGGSDGPGLRTPPATTGYRPTRAQDRHIRTGTGPAGTSAAPAKPPTPTSTTTPGTPTGRPAPATCAPTAAPTTA